jgi:2-polyprenyl-3-methyl-5-hydroxy-6-metoxy-1,4-benzoquinol methylase
MKKPDKFSTNEEMAMWNDEMVKQYHQKEVPFKSKNPIIRILEKMRLKKIVGLARINSGEKILDLGCGEGWLISLLPDTVSVAGIDISQTAIDKAKEVLRNRKNTSLGLGNAYKVNYPEKYFDKIICSEVLEHAPEPQKIMTEIHRLLKDGGSAVISIPDEKRIQKIMATVQFLGLEKLLHAARKQKEYEWHLHSADKNFIYEVSNRLFKINKLSRSPAVVGYHFIANLTKI